MTLSTLPILIALGANLPSKLGPPEATLTSAIAELSGVDIEVTAISQFYRTKPVPVSDQPDFINAAARLETKLDAHELLERLHDLEEQFGRQRIKKWEARVLDLDLIAYRDQVSPDCWPEKHEEGSQQKPLIVPHPRLHERAFVLVPLRDIVLDWQHPVFGESIAEMLGKLPDFEAPQMLDFKPYDS